MVKMLECSLEEKDPNSSHTIKFTFRVILLGKV